MKRLRDLVGLKRVAGGLKLELQYGLIDVCADVPIESIRRDFGLTIH